MSPAKLAVLALLAVFSHEPTLRPQKMSQARVVREITPVKLLPVQSKNPDHLRAGKLLVASQGLGDPSFAKTVVLLVHYDAGGVVGLILNRRTDLPISRVLDKVKAAKDRSDKVYAGGPVDPQVILGLLNSPSKPEGANQICDHVYQISTKPLLEKIISDQTPANAMHLYLGYAGWTPAQLRKEIELGAWFVFPADAATVFNSDPDSLWQELIRQTETQFASN